MPRCPAAFSEFVKYVIAKEVVECPYSSIRCACHLRKIMQSTWPLLYELYEEDEDDFNELNIHRSLKSSAGTRCCMRLHHSSRRTPDQHSFTPSTDIHIRDRSPLVRQQTSLQQVHELLSRQRLYETFLLQRHQKDPDIRKDTFQYVLQTLESTCFPNLLRQYQTKSNLKITSRDLVCNVCYLSRCSKDNDIYICFKCKICVHKSCYGVTQPASLGPWICRSCTLNTRFQCCLCPKKDGALTFTDTLDKWVHIVCAALNPEISIENEDLMEPVTNIEEALECVRDPHNSQCDLCNESGICIRCSEEDCNATYHPICALENSLEFVPRRPFPANVDTYCLNHSSERWKKKQKGTKRPSTYLSRETFIDAFMNILKVSRPYVVFLKSTGTTPREDINPDVVKCIYRYWCREIVPIILKNFTSSESESEESRHLESLFRFSDTVIKYN